MTTTWPADIRRLLDGTDLESKVGLTFQLFTVGISGFAHVALLSVGEVAVDGPDTIRLALWPNSTTSTNLRRTGQGSLGLVLGGAWWLARLEVLATSRLEHLASPLLAFRAQLVELREDRAPYAELTGGLTFDLSEHGSVLDRWNRTIEALGTDETLNDQRS